MVAKQPEDLLLGSARLRYRDDSNTFERELGEFCGLGESVFAPRDTMSHLAPGQDDTLTPP